MKVNIHLYTVGFFKMFLQRQNHYFVFCCSVFYENPFSLSAGIQFRINNEENRPLDTKMNLLKIFLPKTTEWNNTCNFQRNNSTSGPFSFPNIRYVAAKLPVQFSSFLYPPPISQFWWIHFCVNAPNNRALNRNVMVWLEISRALNTYIRAAGCFHRKQQQQPWQGGSRFTDRLSALIGFFLYCVVIQENVERNRRKYEIVIFMNALFRINCSWFLNCVPEFDVKNLNSFWSYVTENEETISIHF